MGRRGGRGLAPSTCPRDMVSLAGSRVVAAGWCRVTSPGRLHDTPRAGRVWPDRPGRSSSSFAGEMRRRDRGGGEMGGIERDCEELGGVGPTRRVEHVLLCQCEPSGRGRVLGVIFLRAACSLHVTVTQSHGTQIMIFIIIFLVSGSVHPLSLCIFCIRLNTVTAVSLDKCSLSKTAIPQFTC